MDRLPVVLVLLAFGLHVLGERRAAAITGRPRDGEARRRAVTFYVALGIILIALESPLDPVSDKLFWAHMIQHLLLLVVAAPLIVLSQPWMSLWRPLPLGLRRTLARAATRSPYLAPLRGLTRALMLPAVVWVVFNVNLVVWHMPGPYDATLSNSSLHVLEHTTFLVFGILFWAEALGCPPARKRLPHGQRIAYLAAAAVPNIALSMFLAFAQHPLYSHYAELAHRPGAIPALVDQQLGAGIMWTAGDLPFAIAIAWLVHGWLSEHEARTARITAPLS